MPTKRMLVKPPGLGALEYVARLALLPLAALYLLWAYQRVFHGEPDDANKTFKELTFKEGAVLLPFLV